MKKFARKDGKKAIDTVCKLYKKKIKGKEVTMKEWSDARAAAYADSARRTARQKHYKKIANKLIQLLKESSPKK